MNITRSCDPVAAVIPANQREVEICTKPKHSVFFHPIWDIYLDSGLPQDSMWVKPDSSHKVVVMLQHWHCVMLSAWSVSHRLDSCVATAQTFFKFCFSTYTFVGQLYRTTLPQNSACRFRWLLGAAKVQNESGQDMSTCQWISEIRNSSHFFLEEALVVRW